MVFENINKEGLGLDCVKFTRNVKRGQNKEKPSAFGSNIIGDWEGHLWDVSRL